MLHETGIEAYSVSVDDRRSFIQASFPSVFMNHAILAIRLPDTVSDSSLYAVVNDPKLGRLLFFDPTNEHVPLGYLPWYLQDNYALVITPDGGELITLPLLPPADQPAAPHRKVRSQLPRGDLSGEIQRSRMGRAGGRAAREFLDSRLRSAPKSSTVSSATSSTISCSSADRSATSRRTMRISSLDYKLFSARIRECRAATC